MRLKDKVAAVTGAASGIGKAIAEMFISEGAKVVFSDISEESGNNLVEDYKDHAIYVKCDVSSSAQVDELVRRTIEKFGKMDIMVNNAGIGTLGSAIDTSDDAWIKTININLSGVFYGIRAAGKAMVENNISGSIINMSSILGRVGMKNTISYSASKGGIEQLTRAAALDLAMHKIRVNAIAPAFIKTGMTKDILKDPEFINLIKNSTPLGYAGEVSDIAYAAAYLASEESRYVTGTILFVDGGWTAR